MKKDIFYKTQIEGLSDVKETVQVIEKSAASHIHFLKKRVEALRAYQDHLQSALGRLSRFYWDLSHPLLKQKTRGKKMIVLLTGERGIVGGLYHELVNEVIARKDEYDQIVVVGSRGKEYLKEEKVRLEEPFAHLRFDKLPGREEIRQMSAYLFRKFQRGRFKKIDVLYSQFISLVEQKPATLQFLPFELKEESALAEKGEEDGLPIFEPSKKFIFNELLKKYIDLFLAKIVLEVKLSEFAARTVTAESAVKETERLVHRLNREFLKARHLAVTQKQIESFSVHQLTS